MAYNKGWFKKKFGNNPKYQKGRKDTWLKKEKPNNKSYIVRAGYLNGPGRAVYKYKDKKGKWHFDVVT